MSDQEKAGGWKMAEEDRAREGTAADAEAPKADDAGVSGVEADADYEALVRLMKENDELKDRSLRAAAEMENLRRRTARDVADARAYAIANFARDMLAVSDNLRRALDAVPPQGGEGAAANHSVLVANLSSLVEGVEMTERAMLSALERHGVKRLAPEGEKFDPNFHQAMFEVPNAEVPANTVVQVVQPGYSIGERVLRPAMVGVAKGGPAAVPKPAAATPEGDAGDAG